MDYPVLGNPNGASLLLLIKITQCELFTLPFFFPFSIAKGMGKVEFKFAFTLVFASRTGLQESKAFRTRGKIWRKGGSLPVGSRFWEHLAKPDICKSMGPDEAHLWVLREQAGVCKFSLEYLWKFVVTGGGSWGLKQIKYHFFFSSEGTRMWIQKTAVQEGTRKEGDPKCSAWIDELGMPDLPGSLL